MLEKLSSSLKNTLSKVAKSIFIDNSLIEELVKDLQRSLLQSDVNVSLVFELSEKIKQRALKEKPPKSVSPKEHLIKIANYYTKKNYKVATLGLDVHRPAAPIQLKQLSDQVNIPCYISKEKDPIKIYKQFENEYKKYDILLIDTAGRDALSKDLIKEIESLNNLIKPDETLLVISADIGQAALEQAKKFHESCNITGVIA